MVSQQLLNIIIKATDQASATAEKVDQKLRGIGKSSSLLSKIPGFDVMRQKLTGVAKTIDGKFGGALTRARDRFRSFKSSISGVTGTLRGKFGGAIDGIRSKLSKLTGGNKSAAGSFGFLRGAASMAVGMLGFELVSSLVETTRASLNARQSLQAFAGRLNMSGPEVQAFQKELDNLQRTYKKVDMDVVGQQATDLSYRLGLPKQSLGELTETTAIFMDAMQRNGKTAEESMLAMSDAMDGQFVRLKELGIGQEELMRNGWSGDLNDKKSLLKGINGALREQHYDDLAKSIDTLDDAWQVLSITMSNLLESVLVPLTPAITAVVNGIADAINTIKDAWNGLPDWGKYAIGVAAVALAIGIIGPAIMAMEAASLPVIGTLIAAFSAISWPVVAVVAVIGLLVAAIYEVGKAFGWWSNVNEMFDAIRKGLEQMWAAFVNHPDVQAAIAALTAGFQWLMGAIGNAWQEVLKFFGVSDASKFDIVTALIEGIGRAWEMIKIPIIAVIGFFKMFADAGNQTGDAIRGFWDGTLVPFGGWLSGVFGPVWSFISNTLNQIVPYVHNLSSAFTAFQNGQLSLPGLITTVLTTLWGVYSTILGNIANVVRAWATRVVNHGANAGRNFLTRIVTYLSQLPGRAYTHLMNLLSRIISAGSRWVAEGRQKASQTVSGIVSMLSHLPGAAIGVLMGLVSSIASAGGSWVSTASNYAGQIVSAIVNQLSNVPGQVSSALSGVAGAIEGALSSALDTARSYVDRINSTLNNIRNPKGGESADGRTSLLLDDKGTATIKVDNSPIKVEEDINIVLDLQNVPSSMDEAVLVSMLQDKGVIRALVENREFQRLDATVKERLNLKVKRASGV